MVEPPKLKQDATASSRGTIYQLWVAVEKCYEMFEKGQKVLIETQGDVTTIDGQIEVKHYKDALTDSHVCFWKTLYNWMQDIFNHTPYKNLILFTTQKFGSQATIANWNDKNQSERLEIIEAINQSAEIRFENAVKETPSKETPPSPPEVLNYQRYIFDVNRREKLEEVIKKFSIEAFSLKLPDYYRKIKGNKLQHILQNKQDDFIKTLFGFITRPDIEPGQSWDISYEDFCKKVAELTKIYCIETRTFPSVAIPEKECQQLQENSGHLFIQKINDIQYQEVIPDAVNDYLVAMKTVHKEFKSYSVPVKRTEEYASEIVRKFEAQHRKRTRICSEVINDSKDFYDDTTSSNPPVFGDFNSTPLSFYNGLLHSELDDESKKLKWRLEQDE